MTADVHAAAEGPDTGQAPPLPARVVVGANGAYWRDFGEFYSMCPVSTDNDPVEPVAVYVRAGEPFSKTYRRMVLHLIGQLRVERHSVSSLDSADVVERLLDAAEVGPVAPQLVEALRELEAYKDALTTERTISKQVCDAMRVERDEALETLKRTQAALEGIAEGVADELERIAALAAVGPETPGTAG